MSRLLAVARQSMQRLRKTGNGSSNNTNNYNNNNKNKNNKNKNHSLVALENEQQVEQMGWLATAFGNLKLLPEQLSDKGSCEEDELCLRDRLHEGSCSETRAYWHLDAVSSCGQAACAQFLAELEAAAQTLGLAPSSREYRQKFTVNYRNIFSADCVSRKYRPDVMEAALASQSVQEIIVNGEAHQFSEQLADLGHVFRCAWSLLAEILWNWRGATAGPGRTGLAAQMACFGGGRASRVSDASEGDQLSDLRAAFDMLDKAWAAFEKEYICELIFVEELARQPVRKATAEMKRLVLDGTGAPECLDRAMLAVARLNAVANPRGKGRGDLHGQVLRSALEWQSQKDEVQRCADLVQGRPEGAQAMVEIVAASVTGAFAKLQEYLVEVEHHMEHLDPSLANNPGLSQRLLEMEEQWDIGDRYLLEHDSFASLLGLASKLEAFRSESTAFAAMSEDCGAELFLVLPRLVWLAALLPQAGCGRNLLEGLLPDLHFREAEQGAEGGERLRRLQAVFASAAEALPARCLVQALFEAAVAGPGEGATAAQGVVEAHAAKLGNSNNTSSNNNNSNNSSNNNNDNSNNDNNNNKLQCVEDKLHELEPWSMELQSINSNDNSDNNNNNDNNDNDNNDNIELQSINSNDNSDNNNKLQCVEDLLHELEPWSMELQRHCPRDWNSLGALLVKSLQDAPLLLSSAEPAQGAAAARKGAEFLV